MGNLQPLLFLLMVNIAFNVSFGSELRFKKKDDSFFVPVAEFVDKNKGLIYIQRGGVDMWDGDTPDARMNPAVTFFDNASLSGEPIAKFKRVIGQKPYHKMVVDGKLVCSDEILKQNGTSLGIPRPPIYPHTYCQTEFYIFRVNKLGKVEYIFYNVDILDEEEGLFSVTNNGKKIYAKYTYLKEDFVASVNQQRKNFEGCLQSALSEGLEEKVIKLQNCIMPKLKDGATAAIEHCKKRGLGFDPRSVKHELQKVGVPEVKEGTSENRYTKEEYYNFVENLLTEETMKKDYKRELNPMACEKKSNGDLIIQFSAKPTLFYDCDKYTVRINKTKKSSSFTFYACL